MALYLLTASLLLRFGQGCVDESLSCSFYESNCLASSFNTQINQFTSKKLKIFEKNVFGTFSGFSRTIYSNQNLTTPSAQILKKCGTETTLLQFLNSESSNAKGFILQKSVPGNLKKL